MSAGEDAAHVLGGGDVVYWNESFVWKAGIDGRLRRLRCSASLPLKSCDEFFALPCRYDAPRPYMVM